MHVAAVLEEEDVPRLAVLGLGVRDDVLVNEHIYPKITDILGYDPPCDFYKST